MPVKFFMIVLLFYFSFLGNAQSIAPKDSISNNLKEVIITQNKKSFSNQNGNIKLDVSNSIYNSIPNTVDLLAKMPTVQVSANRESILVVGKGNPLIYIDNQKVGMNDLNALAVADIKTIDIIQNPSAKYEAEGRVVILITRKFSKKDSFKTEISEFASFKKNYNNYLGINSNFKKNKLELKANFNYNRLNPWEGHSVDYQVYEANIASRYDVAADSKINQFVFGGGLFYKINDDDSFSFNINNKLHADRFPINTLTQNKNKEVLNNVITLSKNDNRKNFINSFLNYTKKIKPIDTQVFIGFQYSNFDRILLSNVENNFNDTAFELAQIRDQKFKVGVFSGRADIEKKFKNEMKLEFGGLYSSANSKSDFDIFYYDTNKNEISHYDFKEENLAGYTQLSGKFRKIDFSIGLRVEKAKVNGKFKVDVLPLIHKNYTNLFPKAQFTFVIDSAKSISLNYAKSISRPNYSSLSNSAMYINPYFLYVGNINLDPTFTNEISSTFQYHDKSVKLSFYQNKNPVFSSFLYDKAQNLMTFKEVNLDKESGFNLDFEIPFSYKLWTTTNSLILSLAEIQDTSAVFLTSKPYLYYYSNNEFKLPKKYIFVVGWWGATKQNKGVYEHAPNFIMDASLSKKIKNWNFTLSCNDIFRSTIYKQQFTINDVRSKARYVVNAHEISIAVRYSFGKIKETEFKEKSIDENVNRIR